MAEDSKFGLADCLNELRSDLAATMQAGKGQDIKFLVEDISLDLQIVASTEASGGGGVKWWILSAEASAEKASSVTQKLSLKLKVVNSIGESIPMGGMTD